MSDKTTLPFFSIIIPTLNEALYLPKLLKDLSLQTFDLARLEIIHVDGDSQDETVIKAKQFTQKLNLRSFVVKKRNVAYQRNFGAKKARGKWILFMDADDRLPNYFLDGIKYRLSKNPNTDVFTTHIKVSSQTTIDKTLETTLNLALEIYARTDTVMVHGAFIGIKRLIAKKINFDEKQKVYEDNIYVNQVISLGFNFKIFSDPCYIYSLRRVRKEGALKMLKTEAILQFKHIMGSSDFSKDNYGYEMLGGEYYEGKKVKVEKTLSQVLQTVTKNQLEKTRKILESLG